MLSVYEALKFYVIKLIIFVKVDNQEESIVVVISVIYQNGKMKAMFD